LSSDLNNDIRDIVSLRFVTCKRPSGTIYAFSEVASGMMPMVTHVFENSVGAELDVQRLCGNRS